MMEERSTHLTVVVGASGVAEELRRSLVQHDIAHAGVTTHLRGLRRSIVLGDDDLVVLCIALDEITLKRHGSAMRQLLADHRCFPSNVRSVGLLAEIGLTSDAAEMGCDLYVDHSQQAAEAVEVLSAHWQAERASCHSPSRLDADAAIESDASHRRSWAWKSPEPSAFASLTAPNEDEGTD